MPRYFFHYRDGTDLYLDPEGGEFPDLAAARNEAIRTARDFIADGARRGQVDLTPIINIEDAGGNLAISVRFSDAVELKL